MTLPELRPRLPLLGIAVAAVLGIALADRWVIAPQYPLALAAALSVAVCLRPRTELTWALAAVGFFALHALHHHGSEGRLLAQALGAEPRAATATGIVWSEPQAPRVWSRNVTCHFLLRLESIQTGDRRLETSAPVQVRWAGTPPVYGDRVAMVGSVGQLPPVRNAGQFDFPAYQQRHGVFLEMQSRYPNDCTIFSHDHGEWVQYFAIRSQHWIRHCLELDLQDAPEISTLIESMLLGAHGDAPDDIRELFQRTGTMHLFAVSGFNVMMLAYLIWLVLKPLRVSRPAAVLIMIPLLGFYALVTGLSASCVRAFVTASIFLAGHLFERRAPAFNSVAASALVILLFDTDQLFSTGFQFTFTVVAILILCATTIQEWLRPFARPDPFVPRPLWSPRQRWQDWGWGHVSGLLGVSVTGWCGSLVFTVGYFHIFSPAAILANLLAVPLSFLILDLGVGAVVAGAISPALASLFNNANWLLAKALLWVLGASAAIPGAYTYVHPGLAARPACEFTVLDVGTGGAIHLRGGGADWMIDCAHGYHYEQVVLPFLRAQGVNSLAGLVLTHGDAQHIGGAVSLLGELRPRMILDSPLKDRSSARRAVHAALEQRGQPKRIVWRGDTLEIAPGVRLTVLFPPAGLQRSSADDKALVLRLEAAGRRALFMSDSGFATEQWLVQNEPDLRADVLVKGQHAKDLSGTPDFLLRVHPAAIVSAQPEMAASAEEHAAWMRSLEGQGIALFPQERCGAVHVAMSREGVRADAFLTGQTFRRRGP